MQGSHCSVHDTVTVKIWARVSYSLPWCLSICTFNIPIAVVKKNISKYHNQQCTILLETSLNTIINNAQSCCHLISVLLPYLVWRKQSQKNAVSHQKFSSHYGNLSCLSCPASQGACFSIYLLYMHLSLKRIKMESKTTSWEKIMCVVKNGTTSNMACKISYA